METGLQTSWNLSLVFCLIIFKLYTVLWLHLAKYFSIFFFSATVLWRVTTGRFLFVSCGIAHPDVWSQKYCGTKDNTSIFNVVVSLCHSHCMLLTWRFLRLYDWFDTPKYKRVSCIFELFSEFHGIMSYSFSVITKRSPLLSHAILHIIVQCILYPSSVHHSLNLSVVNFQSSRILLTT